MRRAAFTAVALAATLAAAGDVPKGYVQAVPRGAIPSIDEPRFVPASRARIPGDAWVLGVVVGGEARAYSLNLLNHFEIVNDRAGGLAFAVAWCPLANAAVVYGRTYRGRELRFEPSGGLVNASLVMRDKETGSLWPILRGRAETGPLAGTALEELAAGEKTRWDEWVRRHPDTVVLSVRGHEHLRENAYADYFSSPSGFSRIEARDRRLETKEPVRAFEIAGRPFAVPLRDAERGAAFVAAGRHVFLHRPAGAPVFLSTRAFVSDGPFALRDGTWVHEPSGAVFDEERCVFEPSPPAVRPLPGFDTYWYVWSLTHPQTEVLSPRP